MYVKKNIPMFLRAQSMQLRSISWDKNVHMFPLNLRGKIPSANKHREQFQLKFREIPPGGGFLWTIA